MLDFCTDPSTDQPWRTVRPAQAKAMRAKMGSAGGSQRSDVTEDELDQMLGTDEAV